jgi:uncharacterized DUF497 family protein
MITEFLWPEDRVDHISRHGVSPEDFEEVCFGSPLVLRARSEGPNPVYHVLGETHSQKHLLCIAIQFPDGKGYPVTARPMTDREKRRYQQWKRR